MLISWFDRWFYFLKVAQGLYMQTPCLKCSRIRAARARLPRFASCLREISHLQGRRGAYSAYFGTNSLGFADPAPNRNFSISATKKARALGSIGVKRFSLINMV
jgi:hypothetical protein